MQTVYREYGLPGFAGMKYDASIVDDVRSFAVEGAEIPFGRIVVQGTADAQCRLPAGAGDLARAVGVLLHSHDYAIGLELGDVGLKAKASANVMNKGKVWVTTIDAAAINGRVFMVHSGADAGRIRATADAGAVEVRGARFVASAAAGALVPVEVDFNVTRSH